MTSEKIKTVKAGAAKAKAKAPKAAVAKAPKVAKSQEQTAQGTRNEVVGIVVSNKMQKTIVVRIDRKVRDGAYFKYVLRSQRVKAHDEKNVAQVGDQVLLVACRPLSKEKRWALKRVMRHDGQAVKVNVANA